MERPRTSRIALGLPANLVGMTTNTTTRSGLEPLMNIEDLAEYLGVPVTTIYDWRVAGKGPCAIRVGRHLKLAVTDVREATERERPSPSTVPR